MKYLLLTLSLLLAAPAQAATYIDIHGISKHFNTTEVWNEKNYGLGITEDQSKNSSTSFGIYKNSLSRTSVYAYYNYYIPVNKYVRIGALVGLTTGYNIPIAPMAAPLISLGNDYRVNIGMLPEIPNVTPAVIFMNFQVKL